MSETNALKVLGVRRLEQGLFNLIRDNASTKIVKDEEVIWRVDNAVAYVFECMNESGLREIYGPQSKIDILLENLGYTTPDSAPQIYNEGPHW